MGKAKRKPHPVQPAWEFATGYSLAECLERLKQIEANSFQGKYLPRVSDIHRQANGSYMFRLTLGDELTGIVEALPDGTTHLCGTYQPAGCLYTIPPTLIMSLIFTAFLAHLSHYIIVAAIGLMAFLMLRLYRDTVTRVRLTVQLIEATLTEKQKRA